MNKVFGIIRNIYWLYRPYIKYAKPLVYFSIIFSVLVMPLSRLIAVYFPELVMESLNTSKNYIDIIFLILTISFIQLGIPMFEDFVNICIREKYQAKIDIQVKREIYEKAQQTDYKFIDSPDYYDDYTWTIDEYSNKCKDSFSLFETLLVTISVIVTLLVAALSSVPLAIVFAIVSIAFRTWGYLKINQLEVTRQDEYIIHDRKRDYIHRIFYSRQYTADLKGTKLSHYLFRDYDEASNQKISIIKKYSHKILTWAFRCDLVYRLSMILIIISITYSIFVGQIEDIGSYITLMLAVERLDECLYELFEVIKQASSLDLYATRIRKFFNRKSSIEVSTGSKLPIDGPFDIEMSSVTFGYESSNFAINNLNLKINKGEKIAIVGENGAGKSTLLKLLVRLYDINSGCILINGIPIQEYNISALRNKIGVAFQDTHVYALSFKENMELYHSIPKYKLDKMINDFNFAEVFDKTSTSVESEITREFCENGLELSGGEMQKVGLARVMSGQFGLLILDEPSSALDPFSEHEVTQMIMSSSNKTTTIMIAHRLSTIKDADHILLISNGKIIESGTHEELMHLRRKYYEMYSMQADSYKD